MHEQRGDKEDIPCVPNAACPHLSSLTACTQLQAWIPTARFSNIFNVATPTSASSGQCPPGFTSVNQFSYNYAVNGTTYQFECLQLNVRGPEQT